MVETQSWFKEELERRGVSPRFHRILWGDEYRSGASKRRRSENR